MKRERYRFCWLNKDAGDFGHGESLSLGCAQDDLRQAERYGQSGYQYWIEPVGDLNPPEKPKPSASKITVDNPAFTLEISQGATISVGGEKYEVSGVELPDSVTTTIKLRSIAKPKPYERKWKFDGVYERTDGGFAARFRWATGRGWASLPSRHADNAIADVFRLLTMEAQRADAELDVIYAEQK